MKMKHEKKSKESACRPEAAAAAILFFAAVLVGVACFLFLPKQAFSDNENRALEAAPSPTLENVQDGSFAESVNNYVNDHFLLRGSLVEFYNMSKTALGQRDLGADYNASPADGGVYLGNNGHIYEVLLPDIKGTCQKNLTALSTFAETANLSLVLLPVPSGAQEQPEGLPFSAPSHNQREELELAQKLAGGQFTVVDVFETLSSKNGDYYYKTDHHWNTYGAYRGYAALAEALGVTPRAQDEFEFRKAEQPFYGTLYSKAILPWQQPDELYLPYFKGEQELTQAAGKQTYTGEDALFQKEYLDKKDKYSTFLGGNRSVQVLKNSKAEEGRKLLLFKDSYGNSLAPFLITQYSEIHIVDLRYFNQNIYQYVKDNEIEQAAAVYSIKQLCDVSFAGKLAPRANK